MHILQWMRRVARLLRQELRWRLKKRPNFPATHESFFVLPIPNISSYRTLSPPRIAIFIHIYYVEQIAFIQSHLKTIVDPFDVYVSTDTQFKADAIESALRPLYKEKLTIRVFENRGRDIAPKFVGFHNEHYKYDYVCHIHTKKSDHDSILSEWGPWILNCLLGTPDVVHSILDIFDKNPDIGIVAPRIFWYVRRYMTWANNFDNCARLAAHWGRSLDYDLCPDFPSGSMFWARPAALSPLFQLNLRYEDFEKELGQIDGTLAHAIERLIFFACETAGYRWIRVGQGGKISKFERPQNLLTSADVFKRRPN